MVAFDSSANAQRALAFAKTYAMRIGDVHINVLHVADDPWIYGEIAVYVQREKMERILLEAGAAMLGAPAAELLAAGIEHSTETLIGDPATTIARRAAELGCTSIVMGTRGMNALMNLVLGSVAMKVLHATELPVTLIH